MPRKLTQIAQSSGLPDIRDPEAVQVCPDGLSPEVSFATGKPTGRCVPPPAKSSFFGEVLGEIVPLVTRGITAVATGGTSEILRLAGQGEAANVLDVAFNPQVVQPQTQAAAIVGEVSTAVVGQAVGGGSPMGFGDFFSGLGDVATGLFQTGVEQIGLPLLQQELLSPQQQQAFFPQPTQRTQAPAQPPVVRTMAAAPAIAGAFRTGLVALNTIVANMRAQGFNATVAKVRGFIRRFGPEAAVGFLAGFGGADLANRAVIESAFLKRRRMNPANVKALRRSMRRVQSFRRLSTRAESSLRAFCPPRRGSRRSGGGRCTVCKVSPCAC